VIISGGGIHSDLVKTHHNCENPATRYDYRIPASTFLPFSGVFPPESFSWVDKVQK
jgi:hypothetical protein